MPARIHKGTAEPTARPPELTGQGGAASRWRRGLVSGLLLMFSLFNAQADRRTSLSWDASPDADIIDYIVQYGVRSRTYSRSIRSAGKTSVTINGLKDGVAYFFTVKAVNRSGFESDPSEEIQIADACAGRLIDLAVTPVQTSADGIKLALPSLPNRKYQVQATEDFQNWTALWTSPITSSQRLLEFLDSQRVSFANRFYRVQMAGPFVEFPAALGVTPVTQPVIGTKLGFYTVMGRAYEVQSSNDGRSWTTIWSTSLSTPGGFVEFIDTAAGGSGSRRYRLMAVADPVAAQGTPCGGGSSLSPLISDPSGQQTYMNVPTVAIPLTVLDPDTSLNNLRLTASSSNPSLVKDAGITFSGSGASRTVTVTPARDQWGTTVIDVVVSDGANATATAFNLDVLPFTPDVFPLVVRRRGSGAIRPNLDGEYLRAGQRYSMTAIPNPGNIFAGWSGGVTSSAPALPFVMRANLELQADFIPNPFPAIQGGYAGLFREDDAFRPGRAGAFSITTTGGGKYSGRLLLGGKSYSFSGQMGIDLKATNNIPRKGTNALAVEVSFGAITNQVTGRITDGAWEAPLLGHRASFHSKTNPAPFAGAYTLILPGQNTPDPGPEGAGFGTVKVDGNGFASFAGTLADGTRVSQKAPLSRQGQWPFFASLYSGAGGTCGWLTITNSSTNDFNGRLDWIKPASPKTKIYPGGFTNETVVLGSRFAKPSYSTNRVLNLADAEVRFSGGNLAAAFTNTVTWSEKNKIANLGDNKLSLSISTSSGLFSGSVVNPATGKSASFKGAVLQKQNFGAGFLLGTNRSARVEITAPAGPN